MRRAVVDVGSNSVLLVVAERKEGAWLTVFESSEVTGLGTDTKATGQLQEEAQRRTLDAVKRAWQKASALGATCAPVATMAVRIAANAADFLYAAEQQGTPIKVLSAEDEAKFGLLAVMDDPAFARCRRISVIDPGGHSTELTIAVRDGSSISTEFSKSFPIGALGLRDGPMGSDSPDAAARFAAACEIDDTLALDLAPGTAGIAVGLGATPTNLVTVRERITEWDAQRVHGQYLDYEEVGKSVAWMCDMTEAERARIVGLERGREKTIHIGALILERFLNALHVEGCYVSTKGWRHALLDIDSYFER